MGIGEESESEREREKEREREGIILSQHWVAVFTWGQFLKESIDVRSSTKNP